MKASLGKVLHLVALDHAPVPDKRHPFATKSPCHLRALGRHGAHIWGIPGKDVYRHRDALFVTQQPKDHLFLPSFAVTVIAKRREGVALALEVTARDVIQKQRRLVVATPGRE